MLRPRGSHDIVVLASSLSCSPRRSWTGHKMFSAI
ncbi:hypothetical protein ABMA59_26730 [Mesorhizobium sp. CN2-181]